MFNIFIRRKPKTKITLHGFLDAVGKVAKETGATHHQVDITVTAFPNSLELRGYLNNPPRFESGKTIEEVCEKLRNPVPVDKPSPITEIVI